VRWQKEIPNANSIFDKEKIIENLSKQIVSLTSEIGNLKSQSSVNVNISSNTQEYEIKIRTLNSRIQELESQLRTQRVDFEGQIRTKNASI
jgi:septal ring factor EnvC (AmiA/AmiB activator)